MGIEAVYEDGTYFAHNPTWHEEDSSWKARQISKMLRKHSIVPSSVCEVGCGAGEVLRSLASEYGEAVLFSGYEISPQAFEICKGKEGQNLRFFLKDVFADNDARFDVVMAIDLFEHVEDYLGFLRKFRNKGEYKIFHIPLDLAVQTVLRSRPILTGRKKLGHLHYFTKETALATLADTGYGIIDYFYTRGTIELPGRSWRSRLAKLPRRMLYSIHRDWAVRILGGFSLLVLAK